MKIAALFPGQGAQYIGMGKDLFDEYEIAKNLFNKSEEILGIKLKKICFEGPEEELKKTENTQPAVLLVSYILYKLLEDSGIKFEAFAGFSLGEYSALVSSGIINIEDALTLVKKRGLIIENSYPAGKGTMGAVLGIEDNIVEEICEKIGNVFPANYNSPGQLVISGEKEAVIKACDTLEEKGAKKTVVLNVSGPFHSPLLKEGSSKLKEALDEVKFNSLDDKIIISNTYAKKHTNNEIKNTLVEHMYSPVKWTSTIQNLIKDGFDTFIEIGPGRVLTGLMRSIDKTRKAISVRDSVSLKEALENLKK